MQVAIDGPAGAGKTSVGKEVADRCGLLFLESGLLYRGVAYARQNELPEKKISLRAAGGTEPFVELNGNRLSNLGSEQLGDLASKLARKEEVRELVTSKIRKFVREVGIVVEGRDIGSVVLPGADVKIFLTASAEARARRRLAQREARPIEDLTSGKLDEMAEAIQKRDQRDISRDLSPLKASSEATIIDSTDLSFEQTVEKIVRLISDKSG